MDYTYTYGTNVANASTDIDPAAMAALGVAWLISSLLAVLMIVCLWKLFVKAGKPGWAAIVPIYNTIVMLEIVGRPIWWIVLLFIPIANFVVAIILMLDFAKAFGKSAGYGVLMLFFPYIMYPILAFGKDTKYVGPVAETRPQYGQAPTPQPVAPAPVVQSQPTVPVSPQPSAPIEQQPPVTPNQPQQ